MKPIVFLALPSSGTHVTGAIPGIVGASLEGLNIIHAGYVHSLLTRGFNTLWCQALNLNPRPDYFAMMHADICAEPGWLDVLIKELEDNDAEVVSSIVAIKDHTKETSTCLYSPETNSADRLSQEQADALPETFGEKDLPPGVKLLVNSGLWVCRFKNCRHVKEPSLEALDVGPWVERFSFGQKDDIIRDKDGLYGAFATTEDWEMSLRWSSWPIKVLATRKVRIGHIGSHMWTYGGKNAPNPNGVLQQLR